MALLFPILHPTGAQPEYWRIVQATINYDRGEVIIELAGYLSEATRQAGAMPLASVRVETTIDLFPEVRAILYNALDTIENPLQFAQDLDLPTEV